MADCCKNLGKFLFFIFNGIFWVVGIAFLAIGIGTMVPGKIHDVVSQLGHSTTQTVGIILIVVGTVSFLVAFTGCCGIIKESRGWLSVYIAFISIILLTEICVGIYVLVEHGAIARVLYKRFGKISDVKEGGPEDKALRTIEYLFNCCGFTKGCKDWHNNAAYGCTCREADGINCKKYLPSECTNKDGINKPMWTIPCYNTTVVFLEDHMYAIGGSVLGIAVAEIFGLIIAIIICQSLNKDKYESY